MSKTVKRGRSASFSAHRKEVFRRNRGNRKFDEAYRQAKDEFNLAHLAREMRQASRKTQKDLASQIGTTASAIARLERVDYEGHSLPMLQKIAAACNVELVLTARKGKGRFNRKVALA